jgi:hypothetical protein
MSEIINAQQTKIEVESAVSGSWLELVGTSITGLGSGTPTIIDVTTLKSTAKEKRKGLIDEGQCTLGFNYDPADAAQQRLLALLADTDPGNFRVTLTDIGAEVLTFAALVLNVPLNDVTPDTVYTSSAQLEITSKITRT